MNRCSVFERIKGYLFCLAALVAGLTLLVASGHAQERTDVVRGVVVDDHGRPVTGAWITVSDSTGLSRTVRSDGNGRFTVLVRDGQGRYSIAAIALGKVPVREMLPRLVTEDVLSVTLTMVPVPVVKEAETPTLAPVAVVATREKPERQDAAEAAGDHEDPASLGQYVTEEGDPSRIAGRLPGVRLTPNGLSVFGMGPEQTTATLDGMGSGMSALPVGVADVALSTASFDPSRGGFSGGQLAIRTHRAGIYVSQGLLISLDAPWLQTGGANAELLGQKSTNLFLNWAGSGPLPKRGFSYSGGIRYNRDWTQLPVLERIGTSGLRLIGLSPDSLAVLDQVLGGLGIPTRAPDAIPNQRTDLFSTLWRLDWESQNTATAFDMIVSGQLSSQNAVGASPTALSSTLATSNRGSGAVQAHYSTYWRDVFLNDTRVSVSHGSDDSRPYLVIPNGNTLIGTTFPSGSLGLSSFAFGGGEGRSQTSTTGVEFSNETSWLSLDGKHRLKLALDAQMSAISSRRNDDPYGSYTYASLAALQSGVPTSFTRTLGEDQVEARVGTGAISLGDAWKPAEALQVQYGLRIDATKLLTTPAYNAALDSTFHVRTDRAPLFPTVSPRLGFTWLPGYSGKSPAMGRGVLYASDEGIVRSVLRGGIGLFAESPGPETFIPALRSTGLPSSQRRLTCVGPAIPMPSWATFVDDPANIPTQCVGGGGVFVDSAPYAQLLGSHYRPPRSLRSVLSYSYTTSRMLLVLDGAYSLGLNQPSLQDVNFARQVQFVLPNEAGRPIFVPASSIVATTGGLTATEARRASAFSSVLAQQSDGKVIAKQLTVQVVSTPSSMLAPTRVTPALSYTIGSQRSLSDGITSNTAADPSVATWARGDGDIRHRIDASLGITVGDFYMTVYGTLASGAPFTPVVGGDINGDGYANDRAFIYDPARTTDPNLRQGMSALLSSLDGRTAACLRHQYGQIAGRNSCSGPWTQTLSAAAALAGKHVGLPSRVNFSFFAQNILGALDQAVHGSRNLRGWGGPMTPDPVLLIPVGFDQTTSQFRYAVNPHFGVNPSSRKLYAVPFTLTVTASIRLSPTIFHQTTQRLFGRVAHIPDTQRTQRIATLKEGLAWGGNGATVFALILSQQDSLGLTADQIASIRALQGEYKERSDSLAGPLIDALLARGTAVGQDADIDRVREFLDRLNRDFHTYMVPKLMQILTAEQLRMLSPYSYRMMTTVPNVDE